MKGIDDIILNKASHIKRAIVTPKPFELYFKIYKAKSDKAVFLYHGWAQGVNPFIHVVQKLKITDTTIWKFVNFFRIVLI